MSQSEFQCVVVGNEPAGLWFLTDFIRKFSLAESSLPLGWVKAGPNPKSVAFPNSYASEFQIAPGSSWAIEAMSKHDGLVWNTDGISRRFPGIEALLEKKNTTRPSDAVESLGIVRSLVQKFPELISFSQAIWKIMGRSMNLQPESMVRGSLLSRDLFWWNAEATLPNEITRLSSGENQVPKLRGYRELKGGFLCLDFEGIGEVISRRFIFNSNHSVLTRMTEATPKFWDLLNIDPKCCSNYSLYPLEIEVENEAIPIPARSIVVWLESEIIPDANNEIFPIQVDRSDSQSTRLTLWGTAPTQLSVERVLESLRQGMRSVNRLFPFSRQRILSFGYPLGIETCHEESQRTATLSEMLETRREFYDVTAFETRSRHRGLFCIHPYHGCDLPYPLGPLHAAQNLVKEALGKKKKTKETQAQPPTISQ